MVIRDEILSRKQAAEDYLSTKRDLWDSWENLFHNKLDDAISEKQSSQVFDPKLSTLTLERAYRVMSQLPTGKVKGISKNDKGTSTLMNLIVDKYINPNANAQFDLLTKFRMVDIYSNIYGIYFVLIDWDVKKNGYIGPDLWLLNIRDVFPQVGAVSPDDSDYMIVRTWKPLTYFERLAETKNEGFRNASKILEKLKDKAGDKDNKDSNSTSKREEDQYPKGEAAKHKGFYEVLTQYEGDRWIDFVTDADMVLRDTKNPNDDGEIPIVAKHSIPLIDDFTGMGDFERGASMQNIVNSNWNLYLDAVKMSIYPPIAINQDVVASKSSLAYIPAAKWMLRTGQGGVNGMISPIQLNPKGIETFNNTYQIANGSLLNLFGTTDTTVTAQTEAGFGKTPEALKMQQTRENTRDNADRFYMEQFLRKVYRKMVNLISKKQSSAITLRLFEDEVQELARSYPEIQEMYDPNTGKLQIDKKHTGSTLYDYEVVSGSTFALDQQSQQENLSKIMGMFMTNPQTGAMIMQMLDQQGYTMKIGEAFKQFFANSGIQDWDKILVEKTPEEQADTIFGNFQQQFEMAASQVLAQNMQQTPAGQPAMPVPGQQDMEQMMEVPVNA